MTDFFEKKVSSGATYFKISGKFDTEKLIALIGVTPDVSYNADLTSENSVLIYGINNENDAELAERLTATVSELISKEELLYTLREKFGLRYHISLGGAPVNQLYVFPHILSRFIHVSGAIHDIDFYVF